VRFLNISFQTYTMTEAPEQRKRRATHGHSTCKRCGSKSFSNTNKYCVKCGYGKTSKRND